MIRSKAGKVFNSVLALTLAGAFVAPAAFADTKYKRVYDARTHRYHYVPEKSIGQQARDLAGNSVVKSAAIGAAAGGIGSAITDRSSVLKGVGVGALTGAGVGAVDKIDALDDNPLIRTAIKGALVGTGTSTVVGGSKVKGAAVGAAAGAGVHYVKDYLDRRDYR